MTLRAQVAFSFLFATLCLAASPVQAQSVLRKSRTITSQDDENSPPLTIRVYKFAPLSSWTLVSAETEAARILRRTHLRLAWINCPSAANSGSCSIPEGPSDLILRVLATALPQASADALGMAAAVAIRKLRVPFLRPNCCMSYISSIDIPGSGKGDCSRDGSSTFAGFISHCFRADEKELVD